MKNFVLGMIAGIAIAVCGYKPYQIEMEYRHNIAAGLKPPTLIQCVRSGLSMTCVDFLAVPRE